MQLHPPFLLRNVFKLAVLALLSLTLSGLAGAQRLPGNVVPSHYALWFAPDLSTATFAGSESIDIVLKEPATTITLNALDLKFESVEIQSGDDQTQSGTVSTDPEKQQATFTFSRSLPAGSATLRVRFMGVLNRKLRGFYLSKTARRSYAVTQFEATDARRAFPCFDEPAMKATFDISLTIDHGDSAISNSPVVSDQAGPGAGKHTVVFGVTPKMSTYLVAFLVGDFQCSSGASDGVALRVCSTPDEVSLTPYALGVAKSALHYYDNYFGIHYPLPKLDLVAIPDFEAGAMENFGAITFRESDLLLDPKTASIRDKQNVAIVVAHEMSHQWFGDLVTMQWWDNIWLNEGFATWMENKCTAALHPEWDISELFAEDEQSTLDIDAQPSTRAIRAQANTPDEIDQMFDGIAYGKAGDVLLMVENYLGAETFRQGVHAYLAAHAYGNATAEDFWNAQTAVSHKPVDRIMESLIAQRGEPILEFGIPANGQVPVDQQRFFLSPSMQADPAEKWTLPVCFKSDGGSNGEAQDCQVLTPSLHSLPAPEANLLFANAGGKGYYRSAYARPQYEALVAHAETGLSPDERISLAGDEWAQVRADKATVGDYLNLVGALKSDPNADVVSIASGRMAAIADRIASSQEERDALAAWVRRTFAPAYAKLGPPRPDDSENTREMRAHLLAFLVFHGDDADLKTQAREIAERYLSDPSSVNPTLGQTALQIAAEYGDAALFDRLQKIYETSTDPEARQLALRDLVNFARPDLLERALDYTVSGKVRNQDAALELAIGLQIPENRDQTWQFIKSHWDAVKAQLTTDTGLYLVAYSGSFCTAAAREDVKDFFSSHPVPAADAALRHALERIDECMEFRRLQEPNLKNWLAETGQ